MIARVVSTGEVVGQQPDRQEAGQYARLAILNPDYGYEVIGYYPIPAGHPHFPYGKTVNPD